MPLFLGTYTPKIDEKGRFFLPAKFRDELSPGLVMVRAQEHCLAIYPMSTFVALNAKVADAPTTLKQVRDFQRILGSGASDQIPDRQGRVMIPPHLRAWAGLQHEIVVAGAIDRLEVWNPQAWERYSAEQETSFAELNDVVFS